MTAQIAFLFPGQGSQVVGMGVDIFEASSSARRVFGAADEALGFSLSNLCFTGPEDTLRETINAQPAIVTVSLALLAALQEALSSSPSLFPPGADAINRVPTQQEALSSSWSAPLTPRFTAGHSVGEYAALVTSGSLDMQDAIKLVRERGRLMHHEGTVCPGNMAAVIGLDEEPLQEVCREVSARSSVNGDANAHVGLGQVAVANYNAPGQIVISGEQSALKAAMELAKIRGAKRVIPLAVSGAFHSPVMLPAAAGLAQAIAKTTVRDAAIPLIGNITAAPLTSADAIREEMAQQIASPVQWVRTIAYLADAGITTFIEIGPGQALTGMVKRIAKGVTTLNIGSVADIEKAISALREMNAGDEV
ncbi:MAG TPA: ACP S-malonyltransferase [Ktedonobacteraceae bacterium]|nr:ACP S-malonyltransferase [Ktedonobacteraceae bacterium]